MLKNDRFTWSVCFGLFCSGVVWGSVRIKEDFFEISSIHDLFDIFSSIATILALAYAVFNVNAWRRQTKGEGDHALAQKLAIACARFKEASRSAYNDAVFSICNKNQGPAEHDGERQVRQVSSGGMADKLKQRRLIREEFDAVMVEVRAIWREEASGIDTEAVSFFDMCTKCSTFWMYANNSSCTEEVRVAMLGSVATYEQVIVMNGWEISMFIDENRFDGLFVELDNLVNAKMLS